MKRLSALTASAVALSLAFAPATLAKPKNQQPTSTTQATPGGTSGTVEGRNVSVGTSGSGYSTGTGTGVAGTADATAVNGQASTDVTYRANDRTARLRANATAQTEDERARSRTMTNVRPNQTVRSTTTNMYKADGERMVRDRVTTITCADGRVVDKMAGCRAGSR